MPDATAERLRECVDAFGGELRAGYYTFDYTVNADQEGHIVDVESKGVPHADLAACTRIALRAMTVPKELLKLRLAEPLAQTNVQTMPGRALVGNLLVVGVMVALADLIIEAGGVTIVIAVSLELSKDIAETVKGKWSCTASCNVQQINPSVSCPDRAIGTAGGPNEPAACVEAKRSATQSTPAGC
ncbi:hypothetical protein [Polyangium fumosum]|uniref:Uncharacterized protein n=1 Tax=Polyangium fumosum TaxID=889272 RepID=A0A4U1JF28_9BACT|nr:hypothetical protein [Polyangium fumosum]TKD09799.1 hypothetical protein E8A74_11615 [Polyangium fumosum]